jgi:hypothetical protein
MSSQASSEIGSQNGSGSDNAAYIQWCKEYSANSTSNVTAPQAVDPKTLASQQLPSKRNNLSSSAQTFLSLNNHIR